MRADIVPRAHFPDYELTDHSKARLPGEACSMPHPEDPTLNRWREPIHTR